jgi:hypothetical protein
VVSIGIWRNIRRSRKMAAIFLRVGGLDGSRPVGDIESA